MSFEIKISNIDSQSFIAGEFRFNGMKYKESFWYTGPGFKWISLDKIMSTTGNQEGTRFLKVWQAI